MEWADGFAFFIAGTAGFVIGWTVGEGRADERWDREFRRLKRRR